MKSVEDIAQRYEPIILDLDKFIYALNRPLKTTFRICPLKASREEILKLLSNLDITQLPFYTCLLYTSDAADE